MFTSAREVKPLTLILRLRFPPSYAQLQRRRILISALFRAFPSHHHFLAARGDTLLIFTM